MSRSTADRAGVALRPFPYPYRSALALCSDIDGATLPVFEAYHRLIGNQLGLPLADSFFGLGAEKDQMAYYLADGRTESPAAPLIREGLASGRVDSIHSWGDFNAGPPDPGGLRDMARRLTDDLTGRGLAVPVWINHGNANNSQNLYARLRPEYSGHDPASPYHTLDLVRRLGVRCLWHSELVSWPLSANRPGGTVGRNALNGLKNLAKISLGRGSMVRPPEEMNDLARPVRMGDGRPLLAFSRFNRHPERLWGLPTRHTLRHSLARPVLDELVRRGGYSIVYTHLGLPAGAGPELFPKPDLTALEGLAEARSDGRIWVATTAQLLDWWLVSRHLKWVVSVEGDRIIIDLGEIDDPVTGPRPPRAREMDGLCFYSNRPDSTVIRQSGRVLPAQVHQPDSTGRLSVGLGPADITGVRAEEG